MLESDLDHPERYRRFTRAEYERLVEQGWFQDERLELLRGMLVTMSPQGAPHAHITAWFVQKLSIRLGLEFDVRGHSPYAATDDSEPEPDIAVQKRTGAIEHMTQPLLLIEVSDSSLRKDRRLKASLYAEAGAPEYWIVDVSGDDLKIHVHTKPSADGYGHIEVLQDGDVLRPTRLDVEIPVLDIPWARD